MHHELKIQRPYYEAIIDRGKRFEIRYNDRGFKTGDTVTLCLWDQDLGGYIDKPPVHATITYITDYQQKDGWVVFGFELQSKS